ncbi:UNVERIFIED_CONTAM: hypothetical protein GTU68_034912 [Idotea baltica]|nr:hypothetical protein [Idotea baltica]
MIGQQPLLYFPFIGLLIGGFAAVVFYLANIYLPQPIAVLISMCLTVLCTGALHEDGLADSADGMGGGWTVEDKLRIMKDSRIGTYGTLALVFATLLKFVALSSLPLSHMTAALICAHVLARWSALPLLWFSSYVGSGSATGFGDSKNRKRLILASGYTALIVVFFASQHALLSLSVALLVTVASYRYFRKKLGGVTGDSLGAANQLIEIAIYLVFLSGSTV